MEIYMHDIVKVEYFRFRSIYEAVGRISFAVSRFIAPQVNLTAQRPN
ncbi:hypothetical protein [Peribacillus simplex]